jgi:uroporphyrinogen decarboxylase
MSKPDFEKILTVLYNEKPKHTPLFEFAIDEPKRFIETKYLINPESKPIDVFRESIQLYYRLGFDFVVPNIYDIDLFSFKHNEIDEQNTRSLNVGAVIKNRFDYDNYNWPDPDASDYSIFDTAAKELPDGMKFIVNAYIGVLENVENLVGFERFCIMMMEDEPLFKDIVDSIGSRLLRYYENIADIDSIGACVVNDDWGFNTATMISPDALRQYIFPWHKKIVETIHKSGKPAILHSCGNLEQVMDDIIYDIKYDSKHSFEDNIIPVEDAYDKWGSDIAILGGLDVNFLSNKSPDQIYMRAKQIVEKSEAKGGYALGSGNSLTAYIPTDNIYAMFKAIEK